MPTPLVSICLPNLNTCRFLAERMETLLAQTVNDWELIICDSHSDGGSWEFFQGTPGNSGKMTKNNETVRLGKRC